MSRTISTRFAIDGEAKYKAKLKSINAELALHKSELEKVQAQYKNSANSLEALSAKQSALRGQLEALTRKHDEQAAALEAARHAQREYAKQAEELRAELDKMKSSSTATAEEQEKLARDLAAAEENMRKAENAALGYQKQINRTERDQYKLGDELKRTDQYLEEARASADGCAHSIDQYGKEVKEAGKSAGEFAEGTEKSKVGIEQLAAALAAAGVAKTVKEITDELLACAAAAGSFETAMAKVATLAGPENLESMKAQLVGLSNETGVAVGSLAEAAYQAMSAGVDAADAVVFVSTATKTSVAGFTDSATAVDVLTTALNAYKLEGSEAGRVASMLVKTQDEGKTSVGELAQNMGRIIPVAAAYNVSLGNLTTAYALLTKNGTNTNIATTNLSAMLTELSKSGSRVADVLQQQTGKSFAELMESGQTLGGIMGILSDSVDGDATAFSNLWSSTTAGQAALSLLNSGAEEFNRTLAVMENSSGAVEQNFQTMADTTEFAQQRMANAAENLRIAIGDQLNPALENLYAAGADAFTWATDFVEENPWVVAAITGVTVALGALTVGTAALAAANAPAVITAIKGALDLLSANPVILVTAALVGLGAAVGVWVSSVGDAESSTHAFTKSLQESKAAYDDLMASMGEEQADAAALADALDGLLAVEGKSAAQKAAIKGLVDDLNEAVPGLSLVYDEEKDSLEGLTAAELAEALAMAQAQEKYEAQADRLKELYVEQAEIAQRLGEAKDGLAEAETRCAGDVEQAASSYGAMAGQQQSAEAATAGLRGTVDALTAAQADNAAQIAELEAATAAYAETQGAAAQGHGEMAAAVEVLRDQMAALQQSYVEAKEKAVESLERQMGLFNEMDGKAKTSVEELIKTLSDQAQYMDDYAANIQKAMEMGVDEGLVKKLSDGSQESAQILDAIVKGGAEDITALNAEFARVEEGKDQFSSVMAELELDFSSEMGKINKKLDDAVQKMNHYEEAYKAGQNNAQGLIDGMESRMEQLKAKAREMAKSALAAYKLASDQHSPSKKFAQAGRYDIQGIIQGAEQEKQNLAAAYEDAAQTALDAMRRHLPSSLEEPKQGADVERHLSAITAAAVNAIADSAASGSGAPIVINLMMPDGAVVASHYFDPLAKYAAANGTPILNQPR